MQRWLSSTKKTQDKILTVHANKYIFNTVIQLIASYF